MNKYHASAKRRILLLSGSLYIYFVFLAPCFYAIPEVRYIFQTYSLSCWVKRLRVVGLESLGLHVVSSSALIIVNWKLSRRVFLP